jgi:hypothetical protein
MTYVNCGKAGNEPPGYARDPQSPRNRTGNCPRGREVAKRCRAAPHIERPVSLTRRTIEREHRFGFPRCRCSPAAEELAGLLCSGTVHALHDNATILLKVTPGTLAARPAEPKWSKRSKTIDLGLTAIGGGGARGAGRAGQGRAGQGGQV